MKKVLILLLSLCALTASAQTDNVGRRKPTTSTAKPKPATPAKPAAKPATKLAPKPVARPAASIVKYDGISYAVTSGNSVTVSQNKNLSGGVTIPASFTANGKTYTVTAIEDDAFIVCKDLTRINIPASIEKIDSDVFSDCSNLTSINVDVANTSFRSIDGVLFNKDATTLLHYPAGKAGASFDVPNGVTNIGESAFYGCSALVRINMPRTINAIGEWAFSDCASLTTINCYADQPPTMRSLSTNADRVTIHVPHGCTAAYKQDQNWGTHTIADDLLTGTWADIGDGTSVIVDFDYPTARIAVVSEQDQSNDSFKLNIGVRIDYTCRYSVDNNVITLNTENATTNVDFYKYEYDNAFVTILKPSGVTPEAFKKKLEDQFRSNYYQTIMRVLDKRTIDVIGDKDVYLKAPDGTGLSLFRQNSFPIKEGYLHPGTSTTTPQTTTEPAPAKPAAKPEPATDKTFTANGVSFKMIYVDGGTFQMGATSEQTDPFDSEKPVHSVTLSSYMIGETEVTQALWKTVMGTNPSNFKGDNLPVEQVSWEDCQDFVYRLSDLTGQRFRLPTEAEWEYAARGGNKSRGMQYSGAYSLDNCGWYDGNSGSKTNPVATKQANELGIYDMSGNVYEWCQDWYGSYSSSAQTNPKGPSSGSDRVYRGGSWTDDARMICRVAFRGHGTPSLCYGNLGLRLAL